MTTTSKKKQNTARTMSTRTRDKRIEKALKHFARDGERYKAATGQYRQATELYREQLVAFIREAEALEWEGMEPVKQALIARGIKIEGGPREQRPERIAAQIVGAKEPPKFARKADSSRNY